MAWGNKSAIYELPRFSCYADANNYLANDKPIRGTSCIPLVSRRNWRTYNAIKMPNGDIHLRWGGDPDQPLRSRSALADTTQLPQQVMAIMHPDDSVTVTMHDDWSSMFGLLNNLFYPGFWMGFKDNRVWMTVRNAAGEKGDYALEHRATRQRDGGGTSFSPFYLPFKLQLARGEPVRLTENYTPVRMTRKTINRKALKEVYAKHGYADYVTYMSGMFHLLKDPGINAIPQNWVREEHNRLIGEIMDSEGLSHRKAYDVLMERFKDLNSAVSPDLSVRYEFFITHMSERSWMELGLEAHKHEFKKRVIALHPEALTEEEIPVGTFAKQVW